MKTKIMLLMIPFLLMIMGMGGCEDKGQEPEEKILGKWIIESTGETEDHMHHYDPYGVNNDDYFEFLPDKTIWHYCGTCVGDKYFQTGTYVINSEHYYRYTESNNVPDVFYYYFYDNRLKIISVDPITSGLEKVNITNIIIYKRIK